MYQGFIKRVLERSSQIARQNYGKVEGFARGEDRNQVLTEVDIQIAKLVLEEIREKYPEHNVIDEEAGFINKDSRFTWVVNPVNGSSNFAEGLPQYGIYLGLLDDGNPIAGGLSLPSYDEIYLAEKGKGATLNGKPSKVTDEPMLINVLIAYFLDAEHDRPQVTRNEMELLAEIVLNIRNLRTSNSGYDVAQVANGSYGALLARSGQIWDQITPVILLEEAGAKVTDFFGKPLDFSDPMNRIEHFTLCAAPPKLHSQLQKIINNSYSGSRVS